MNRILQPRPPDPTGSVPLRGLPVSGLGPFGSTMGARELTFASCGMVRWREAGLPIRNLLPFCSGAGTPGPDFASCRMEKIAERCYRAHSISPREALAREPCSAPFVAESRDKRPNGDSESKRFLWCLNLAATRCPFTTTDQQMGPVLFSDPVLGQNSPLVYPSTAKSTPKRRKPIAFEMSICTLAS